MKRGRRNFRMCPGAERICYALSTRPLIDLELILSRITRGEHPYLKAKTAGREDYLRAIIETILTMVMNIGNAMPHVSSAAAERDGRCPVECCFSNCMQAPQPAVQKSTEPTAEQPKKAEMPLPSSQPTAAQNVEPKVPETSKSQPPPPPPPPAKVVKRDVEPTKASGKKGSPFLAELTEKLAQRERKREKQPQDKGQFYGGGPRKKRKKTIRKRKNS